MGILDPKPPTRAELTATYGRPVLKVEQYGKVDTTGATDSSNAVIAANNDAVAKGAILEFPRGTIRIDSQIIFPQTGGKQNSVRWTGQGRATNWQIDGGTGGTILDLRYNGTGCKIETYGQGLLEIDHMTLADDGTDTTPYLLTIGTTLHAHDLTVTGNPSKSGFTCDQDVFILGGLEGTTGNNGPANAFQGYGTVIERVLFDKIRTGVRMRRFANSVIVSDLSYSNRCGSNGDQAAIEIDPGTGAAVPGGEPAAFAYGNIIRDCLIEVMKYKYGIRLLNKSEHNIIRGCSFWDADTNAAYLADIYIDTGNGNIIRDIGVQRQGKALTDLTGQNYWFGPMFGSTGYVNTMVGGNQGLAMRGSIKARYTDALSIMASDGTTVQTTMNGNGVEVKNDGAFRAKDSGGTVRALVSLTSSNQIMLGDVLTALSNQSVIINASATSVIRARIGGNDKIQVNATGIGFNGAVPVKPSLTYSKAGETAAEAQLRAALVSLGLVTDNTVA